MQRAALRAAMAGVHRRLASFTRSVWARRIRRKEPSFKPFLSTYIARFYGNDVPWSNEAAAEETAAHAMDAIEPQRATRSKAILSWAAQLVILAVYMWIGFWLWGRWLRAGGDDLNLYVLMYFMAIPMSLYGRAYRRDRRTRLKPSPFFFWFSGR